MKRTLFSCLLAATMLTVAGATAQAQPVASLAKAGLTQAEGANAGVVKVGWRSNRRNVRRHRGAHRVHRGQRRYGMRGQRRAAAMMPYVPPGVVSMLIKRRKCLDALFPATDPACR
jgi:hypothetical protein